MVKRMLPFESVSEETPPDFQVASPPAHYPATDFRLVILEMSKLSNCVEHLIADVKTLTHRVDSLQQQVGLLRQDVSLLQQDVSLLKQDISLIKQDVSLLKQQVSFVKGGFWTLSGVFGLLGIGALLMTKLGFL